MKTDRELAAALRAMIAPYEVVEERYRDNRMDDEVIALMREAADRLDALSSPIGTPMTPEHRARLESRGYHVVADAADWLGLDAAEREAVRQRVEANRAARASGPPKRCCMADPPFASEPCWGRVSTTWDGYEDAETGEFENWEVDICEGHANWPDGPYIPRTHEPLREE